MQMTVRLIFTGLCLCICVFCSAQNNPVDQIPVTVEAEAVGLGDLLAELSQQTGASIITWGNDLPSINLGLADVPFGKCINTLADTFGLVCIWQNGGLAVSSISTFLAGAEDALWGGQTERFENLVNLTTKDEGLYGSKLFRQAVNASLKTLAEGLAVQTLTSTEPNATLAQSLADTSLLDDELRLDLLTIAVRSMLWANDIEGALAIWQAKMQPQASWQTAISASEIFMTLHHANDPRAMEFWQQTFSLDGAKALFDAGWKQRQWRESLHLARLNAWYAQNLGRGDDATQLLLAVDERYKEPRVIQVACAVDVDAMSNPDTEGNVKARIEAISKEFEENFGITFKVTEIFPWDPPSDGNFDMQYAALRNAVGTRKPELTIGFILEVIDMKPEDFAALGHQLWTGFGCPHMGSYLLARDFSFETRDGDLASEWTMASGTVTETLTHEMAHMFGALHVDAIPSVMRPVSDTQPIMAFDDINRNTILLHKWQDMDFGIESLDEPELLGLVDAYQQLGENCSRPNGSVEEQARVHLALGKLYQQRYDLVRATTELQKVLEIGIPETVVLEAQILLEPPVDTAAEPPAVKPAT